MTANNTKAITLEAYISLKKSVEFFKRELVAIEEKAVAEATAIFYKINESANGKKPDHKVWQEGTNFCLIKFKLLLCPTDKEKKLISSLETKLAQEQKKASMLNEAKILKEKLKAGKLESQLEQSRKKLEKLSITSEGELIKIKLEEAKLAATKPVPHLSVTLKEE